METGEYIGKDGLIYRWRYNQHGDLELVIPCDDDQKQDVWQWEIRWSDIDAAKVARDAFIEEKAEEWGYLMPDDGIYSYMRISRDGETVQDRNAHGQWAAYDGWWIKAAYRKGREVALEQVQELAIALVSLEGEAWTCPLCSCVMDDTSEPRHRRTCPVALAKKVKM